jgi:hypothetical protein
MKKYIKTCAIVLSFTAIIGTGIIYYYRDSVSNIKIGVVSSKIIEDCLSGAIENVYKNEFPESWVFERAKAVKVYSDFPLSISDHRVQLFPLLEYEKVKETDPDSYNNNTLLIVVRERPERMDGVEISYAWGPLAAHGVQLKITGNGLRGFSVSLKHAWIS